jgi:hypothetical protein
MNRISSRIVSILSAATLAAVMTASAFAQAPAAQAKLTNAQLSTLIATAKTPAEHQRIADYYKAEAQDYLAQAAEHKAMIVAYRANPSSKHQASEITHCENLVTSLDAQAAKSQEMAKMHEQMSAKAGL